MKKLHLILIFVTIGIVATFYYINYLSVTKEAAHPVFPVLSIVSMGEPASIPILIAIEEDLFINEGINVQLILSGNDTERDNFIKSGKVDGGIMDIGDVAFMQEHGFYLMATSSFYCEKELINEEEESDEADPGEKGQIVVSFTGEALENKKEEIDKFHQVCDMVLTSLADNTLNVDLTNYEKSGIDFTLCKLVIPHKEHLNERIRWLNNQDVLSRSFSYEQLVKLW